VKQVLVWTPMVIAMTSLSWSCGERSFFQETNPNIRKIILYLPGFSKLNIHTTFSRAFQFIPKYQNTIAQIYKHFVQNWTHSCRCFILPILTKL